MASSVKPPSMRVEFQRPLSACKEKLHLLQGFGSRALTAAALVVVNTLSMCVSLEHVRHARRKGGTVMPGSQEGWWDGIMSG